MKDKKYPEWFSNYMSHWPVESIYQNSIPQYEEYSKNIGKECIIIESTIAGLGGKKAIIKNVSGNWRQG